MAPGAPAAELYVKSIKRYEVVSRLHRLLTTKHQPPLPLERICRELECSESTAKRAIRDLRNTFQHPIVFDKDKGGYRYNYNAHDAQYAFELPGLRFTESEMRSLLTMRRLLLDVQPGLFGKALLPLGRKVEALLGSSGKSAEELSKRIRLVALAPRRVNEAVFRACADTVLERRRLEFTYKVRSRPDEQAVLRRVSPQRLVHYRDNWYLDAWCHTRDALRTFALEQMQDPRVIDEAATEVDESELDTILKSAYGIFSGLPSGEALLKFSPERSHWVAKEEWHPKQKGRYLLDGSWEVSIPYSRPDELIMDILKHGPHCEVLGPPDLRAQVAALLAGASQNYSHGQGVQAFDEGNRVGAQTAHRFMEAGSAFCRRGARRAAARAPRH